MKRTLLLSIFMATVLSHVYCQAGFDKKLYYKILTENNTKDIDEQILLFQNLNAYSAHKGALEMKKAGLISNPSEKLSLFKSGKTKLESAIEKDTNSTELRFLRLLIQENSPKIVHYDQHLKQDAMFIRLNYQKLPPLVQQALYDYSKKSIYLSPEDFKSLKHE